MQPQDSRREYDMRMHRVLAHIDQHISEALHLPTLAGVAHFSPFHFHRLFTAWMGETLGDYLRRRRIEVAAQRLLVQPDLSVLNAALAVGFGSGEAFSRAFKLRFGEPPSTWRTMQLRKPDQERSNFSQAAPDPFAHHGHSSKPASESPMKVSLINRPAARVAYLRYTGPYGAAVAQFYGTDVYPWMVKHNFLNRPRYGISLDDPAVTAPEQCRYDAAVHLPEDFVVPRSMLTTTIAGGQHAVAAFEGTVDEMPGAWQRILRNWLPESGYQLGTAPGFEFYPEGSKYDPATGVFDCQICIPVIPL
jgi:AraC family transcriptional regulator